MESEKMFKVSNQLHERPICRFIELHNLYEERYPLIKFKMEICSGEFNGEIFNKLGSYYRLAPSRGQFIGEYVKLMASGDYSLEILVNCVKGLSNILINPD